jgi:DNA-directed RNA polymerase subunit K/omega
MSTNEPKEIISDEVVIGEPTLTRFERARIIGARALQLSLGAPPLINTGRETDPIKIAQKEVRVRALPLIVRRVLPGNSYQIIPLRKLKDLEFIEQSRQHAD